MRVKDASGKFVEWLIMIEHRGESLQRAPVAGARLLALNKPSLNGVLGGQENH